MLWMIDNLQNTYKSSYIYMIYYSMHVFNVGFVFVVKLYFICN